MDWHWRWLIVGGALIVTLSGCKQGEGDRCQTNSDCDDGFICRRPQGNTPQAGGVCAKPGTLSTDMAVGDASASADLSDVDSL